jgi:hypothetical protein
MPTFRIYEEKLCFVGTKSMTKLEAILCSQHISRMRKRRKKQKTLPHLGLFLSKVYRIELSKKNVSCYYLLKAPYYKYCSKKSFKHNGDNVPDVTVHSVGSVL